RIAGLQLEDVVQLAHRLVQHSLLDVAVAEAEQRLGDEGVVVLERTVAETAGPAQAGPGDLVEVSGGGVGPASLQQRLGRVVEAPERFERESRGLHAPPRGAAARTVLERRYNMGAGRCQTSRPPQRDPRGGRKRKVCSSLRNP